MKTPTELKQQLERIMLQPMTPDITERAINQYADLWDLSGELFKANQTVNAIQADWMLKGLGFMLEALEDTASRQGESEGAK